MKSILVTGGAGYIGSHTVVSLIESGYQPVIVDTLENSLPSALQGIAEITNTTIPFYQVDVSDKNSLKEVFAKHPLEGVIHFAAWKAVGESVAEPLKYYHNNIQGLVVLLEVMREFGVQDIVFSSSCTVYGQPDSLPVGENAPLKQAESPYGFTKQVGEQILSDYHTANKESGIVLLRYFNPIGAHPSSAIGELPLGTPNNLVPFITQTAAGIRQQLTVFGSDYNTPDGTCIRDYIHVCDLADAHVKALEWLSNNPKKIDVFNVGTGRGNTVLEVISAFEKASGQKLNYSIGERRAGDVEQVFADNAKATSELKWKAKYSLEDCLLHAWQWQEKLKEA